MKVLFHRTSPVVRSLEIVGLVLSIFYLKQKLKGFDATAWLFCSFFALYLFVRICDLIPWYPSLKTSMGGIGGRAGIRVHFQKALVPTSYLFAVTALFALLDLPVISIAVVLFSDLMMLVVAPVNGILIYFHRRDKDPLPINYFSQSHYQADEEGTKPRERFQASVR